jgi:hypothetical protein
VADPLGPWARDRTPDLVARAEAEAVAVLRDALVRAALEDLDARRAHAVGASPSDASVPTPDPAAGAGDLLWAYGVVDARAQPPLAAVAGIAPGGPVLRIEAGGLAALVSRVPRSEFAAEPLRENLNDLAWLERVARAHEAVLDGALAATTVVPLRLCTIYESDERLRAMLTEDHAALTEALELLAGRQEWGAKLLVDPERLHAQARATCDAANEIERGLEGRTEGGAYLERRRLERHVGERAEVLAAQLAEGIHRRLCQCAVDAVTRPPQNRDLSGHEGEMLLNAAYLVEADEVGQLRAVATAFEDAHADAGARVELTGPWPPYNFLPRDGAAAQP